MPPPVQRIKNPIFLYIVQDYLLVQNKIKILPIRMA